jgi:hypothetical protein
MRDPDLVVRAQRAAAELERAWDRFRTAHGLGAEPLAPVSSYVGYSLEEPWGEPRVVFGVSAEEAEQLAALLNSNDCGGRAAAAPAGPGRAAVAPAGPGRPAVADGRLASLTAAAEIARAAAGARLQVPAQGPAAPRENAANFADARERPVTAQAPGAPQAANPQVTAPPPAPPLRPGTAPRPVPPATASAPSPAAAASAPSPAVSPPLPAPAAASVPPAAGETALTAFRPDSASLPGDGPDLDPFPDEHQAAGGQPAERPRGHRHAGGHPTQRPARPKRGSAVAEHDPLPPAKQAAARRGGGHGHDGNADSGGSGLAGLAGDLAAMAGDLAGWASGELPGQARPTVPWTPTYRDPDDADPASGTARRDKVV